MHELSTCHKKLTCGIFVIKVTVIMIGKRGPVIISEKGKFIMIGVVDLS